MRWSRPTPVTLVAVVAAAVTSLVLYLAEARRQQQAVAEARLHREELVELGDVVEKVRKFKAAMRDLERRVQIINEIHRQHLDPGEILSVVEAASSGLELTSLAVKGRRMGLRLRAKQAAVAARFAERLAVHEMIKEVEIWWVDEGRERGMFEIRAVWQIDGGE